MRKIITQVQAHAFFLVAAVVTLLVGMAPFLPGAGTKQTARDVIRNLPQKKLTPVKVQPIGILPKEPGVDVWLGAESVGDKTHLKAVGLDEEVWITLPDGRHAKAHARVMDPSEIK